jgi:hypothetical protein
MNFGFHKMLAISFYPIDLINLKGDNSKRQVDRQIDRQVKAL